MSDSQTLHNATSVAWWGHNANDVEFGNEKPFTSKDYQKLPKFDGLYTPLLFTIEDPTLVGLPPKEQHDNDFLNFKIEVYTHFHYNRFWRPKNDFSIGANQNYMQINFKGVEHSDIPLIKLSVVERVMFEMAMYHFNWDFTEWPHKQVSTENFKSYVEYVEKEREEFALSNTQLAEIDLNMEEILPLASKKEMKATILAVEYLHFIEYFRFQNATTLMATPQLVGDYNYWWKWTYTNSISEKAKEERNKKKKVLQTTISRIDDYILERAMGKGNVGGKLTLFAQKNYTNWIKAKYGEKYFEQLYPPENWAILSSLGKDDTKDNK